MRLTSVQALFQQQYPDGAITRISSQKVGVRFKAGGRVYKYSIRSNYELAERLKLIPHDDITTIAQRVLCALLDGETCVIDQSGAGDTVRWHWTNECNEESYVDEEPFSTDEYGRTVSMYTVSTEPNKWSCG